ncbi:tetratricopeptide repeat protein [Pseudomonas stutzeri]|nr:tetratricopeptide repeat protein [Stutzerimonas stutzeri]
MNKVWLVPLALLLLAGCATPVQRGSIPVVEAGRPAGAGSVARPQASAPQAPPRVQAQDPGVVVVPQAVGAPIQTFPAATGSAPLVTGGGVGVPAPVDSAPPVGGASLTLAADERLDGPVLALLTSAQQMERGGNLSGASASLERAQRIAPREPQVLYRLAEVRLAQGNPAQAEQLARQGLTYAGGRPALQASLWEVVARAREQQGDAAGAAQARQRARVQM